MPDPLGQIRLVKIPEAFDGQSPIEVKVDTYALEKIPSYRALSYTCGPPFTSTDSRIAAWTRPSADLKIICNGHSVQVTQSLLEALEQIIPRFPGSFLWVDLICIDQENEAEKVKQNHSMDKIYRLADKVVLWLGHDSNLPGWSEQDQETIDEIPPKPNEIKNVCELSYLHDVLQANEVQWAEDVEADLLTWGSLLNEPRENIATRFVRASLGLVDIVTRVWWFRLWTFHELMLTKSTIVFCGSHSFDFKTLQQLAAQIMKPRMLPHHITEMLSLAVNAGGDLNQVGLLRKVFFPTDAELPKTRSDAVTDIETIQRVMYGIHKQGGYSFGVIMLQLMVLTHNRSATEQRDMVRGLVGIAKAISKQLEENIDDGFTALDEDQGWSFLVDMAKHMLLQDAYLDTLRYCNKFVGGRQWNRRVSWEPDFDDLGSHARLPVTGDSACGTWNPRDHGMVRRFQTAFTGTMFPIFLVLGNEAFGLRGIKVGTINTYTQVPGLADGALDATDVVDAHYLCLLRMTQFCRELPQRYRQDASWLPGLWRTLMLNRSPCSANEFQTWAECTHILWHSRSSSEQQKLEWLRDRIDKIASPETASKLLGFHSALGDAVLGKIQAASNCDNSSFKLEDGNDILSELAWQRQDSGISLPPSPYRLFQVDQHWIGSTTAECTETDQVWILEGGRHPFILRPTWIPGYCRLVGEAYVDRIMRGEFLEACGSRPDWRDVWLV